ncbi:MAG: hypothetical protein U9R32_02380 [Bacteroidota bacterium]|nr:hypothetical protein [Bacteroidota bacterium]
MKVSIDISYYPLKVEYIPPIQGFIDRLNTYQDIDVKTNGMSTQVFGEYRRVMEILTDEIEKAFELPHSIFVLKVVNAELKTY